MTSNTAFPNLLNDILPHPHQFPLKRWFWKVWYNVMASTFSDIDIVFMNYGYADLESDVKPLALSAADEKERYCLQLYHHVASGISLEGLDVLEVGCGRGGGSSYIKRYLNPKTMTGVDLAKNNIEYCRQHHSVPNLEFFQGDAEALSLKDSSFDAVVNIESSHCYPNIQQFFAEVFRVLRPNGYFLFSDYRPQEAIGVMREYLEKAGFEIVTEENITPNVLKSMDLEQERKWAIIEKRFPKFFRGIAHWFAGSQGTPIYAAYEKGETKYLYYILRKPAAMK